MPAKLTTADIAEIKGRGDERQGRAWASLDGAEIATLCADLPRVVAAYEDLLATYEATDRALAIATEAAAEMDAKLEALRAAARAYLRESVWDGRKQTVAEHDAEHALRALVDG